MSEDSIISGLQFVRYKASERVEHRRLSRQHRLRGLTELEWYSWQEHLPRPVEFREEPPSIALRAHDQRRSLQFIDCGFAICDLTELNPMLANRIFEFGQSKFHLQNSWSEDLHGNWFACSSNASR